MSSAIVRCENCGKYVPLGNWPHKCGTPIKKEINFKALTHKQVVDHYFEHPEEIEPGLHDMTKELPVFRGRVDLVGRDKKENVCLIEVAHRSNNDRKFWIKKLQRYRHGLNYMGSKIFRCERVRFRLLFKKAGMSTEDVTSSL